MIHHSLYLDFLFRYRSACSVGKVSLLAFCHYWHINYYSFLGWYGHFLKTETSTSTFSPEESPQPSSLVLSVIHVSPAQSCKPVNTSSPRVMSKDSDVISIRLKLHNGIEISKQNTNLETIISLLQQLKALC